MNNIEKQLTALHPASQEKLATKILAQLEPKHPHLPLMYSGIAGSLVGAAAMFLLMCTLSKPQIIVQEIIREVPVEAKALVEPVEHTPIRERVMRPEIAILGMRLTPLQSDTVDLDTMLAERAEFAKRGSPRIASVYPRRDLGRRATNIEFSPKEYQILLEAVDFRL